MGDNMAYPQMDYGGMLESLNELSRDLAALMVRTEALKNLIENEKEALRMAMRIYYGTSRAYQAAEAD
jgi:hypothetical protein